MLTWGGFSGKSKIYLKTAMESVFFFFAFIPAMPLHVLEAALHAALLKIHVHGSYD